MKRKFNTQGFAFIVPMTLAIVIGFSILAVGAFTLGEITTTLDDSIVTVNSSSQQNTSHLLGNITEGFADVVDIEIVVIIITALSMAIFAVMAVGARRGLI